MVIANLCVCERETHSRGRQRKKAEERNTSSAQSRSVGQAAPWQESTASGTHVTFHLPTGEEDN